MRRIILALSVSLLSISTGYAQGAFWGFDENNQEAYIPIQCDGQFDETQGGVFMPTPEELYEQGESFLLEKGDTKNNASYCLLSAAIQGNVKAQYRVAQLYNKGFVLPQNDIAAYRWAFLAALGGSKEAEQLALTLEQILSSEEIQMATQTIEPMLPGIKQKKSDSLKEQEDLLAEKKEQLEKLNKEIDELLGVEFKEPEKKQIAVAPEPTKPTQTTASKKRSARECKTKLNSNRNRLKSSTPKTVNQGPIFTEKDRMK